MIYLCSPYSHPDPAIREYRYKKSCRATEKLIAARLPVFSPLCNSVPAVELGGLEANHSTFMGVDLLILRRCDEVLLLGLDGWSESEGVKLKMWEAFIQKIPITLIEKNDIELLPKIPKTAWHWVHCHFMAWNGNAPLRTVPKQTVRNFLG